jgi:hypothetical protein
MRQLGVGSAGEDLESRHRAPFRSLSACYHVGVSDVYALVRSIREKRFPRNRYFDEHATPDGAQARRLCRFLRGIEKDLLAADEVVVERVPGWRITMRFPAMRLERVVSLSEDEHAILVEDPCIAEKLRLA